jgi:hypothetical protein
MKLLLTTILITFFVQIAFTLNSFSYLNKTRIAFGLENTKSPQRSYYKIDTSFYDPTINLNETTIRFKCISPNGGVIQSTMKLFANGDSIITRTDSLGYVEFVGKPGKYKFSLGDFSGLMDEMCMDSIELRPQYRTEIHINFAPKLFEINVQYNYDKPVIYLYPTDKMNVSVKLNFKGDLTFTYPTYQNGWNIIAQQDGTITHENKTLRYLFWEGTSAKKYPNFDENVGFVVGSDTLVSFLESSLTQMGLNSIEIQDFITFWAPKMLKNKQNYIHFLLNESCKDYAELEITPKPDNVLRVFMIWRSEERLTTLYTPQIFPNISRNGFTVIEWGGSEYKIEKL